MSEIDTKYIQNSTLGDGVKYNFLYDEVKRDLFTNEQVGFILEKIQFALEVYKDAEDSQHSVDNALDVIDWIKRDILG
tara:strand:- start:4918 stop:5151 length:234 start_codon:yes stop_codon:yes gene_type:complete